MAGKQQQTCSFCGKHARDVQQIVAGPGVNICNECIDVCNSMMAEPQATQDSTTAQQAIELLKVPQPQEIKSFLDEYVVGHDYTKRVLSVAVYNHYKRLRQESHFQSDDPLADVEIEKSNILLIGPTGSGKTLLAKTLARMLDVPFAIADATTLTEAGYVGEDVENILLGLIQNAGMDIAKAELGIIYIDEIDKIGRKTQNVSLTRDVSGEGVQQALLKILEGTVSNVPPQGGRKHPQQKYVKINTEKILFICGGAFVGLDEIVSRRAGKGMLGFHGKETHLSIRTGPGLHVEPEDLVHYGLIPELVGRVPVITSLSELSETDLVKILLEPRNCMVRQYQKLMAMEGVELSFTDSALKELARLARARGTGARGLRAIMENLMLDIMFDAPGGKGRKTIRISKPMVSALTGAGQVRSSAAEAEAA